MRYPDFLKDNGRIGFVAPSFGASSEPYYTRFVEAKKNFANLGYKCVEGPNVYENKGIGKSNTPIACGQEINDFFTTDRSDVILSVGGGETMCEDLDYIDFEAIAKARPIWYMGYSDNTNLTFTLPTLCDTAAIYASCAGSYFSPMHKSEQDALALLRGEKLGFTNYEKWELFETEDSENNPLAPLNATEPFKLSAYIDGRLYRSSDTEEQYSNEIQNVDLSVEGRLLGGCLDILNILAGTQYDRVREFNNKYEKDGVIWFLEACDANVFSIRRILWQLGNAGWFDNARGFLIGRPLHYEENIMGLDRFEAVTGILGKYKVPIILDLDIGHLPPRMPILTGALAKATVKGNSFGISYKLS